VVLSVLAYLIGSLSEGIFQLPLRAGARSFGGGPTWELSWRGEKSLGSLVRDRVGRVRRRLLDEGLYLKDLFEYQELAERVETEFDTLNRAEFVYSGLENPDRGFNYPEGFSLYKLLHVWGGADKQHSEPPQSPTWVKYVEGGPLRRMSVQRVALGITLDWGLRSEDASRKPKDIASLSADQLRNRQRTKKREIIDESLEYHLTQKVAGQVAEEMPLVATRLLGKETDLFHEFDRQRGESNFRLVILPPLLLLSIVLAFKVNVFFLLMLVSVPLFYWQGVRYRQQASDVLVDSLVVGRVEAPAIEKLERAAERAIGLKEPSTTSGEVYPQ
jgi:hypothetical protein